MSKIKWSSPDLWDASGTLYHIIEDIKKHCKKLRKECEASSSYWKGTAQENIQGKIEKNIKDAEKYCDHIKKYSDNLETAYTKYNECERRIASRVSKLKGMI